MHVRTTSASLLLVILLIGSSSTASAQERTAIVTNSAPIFVIPDANRTPLRVAAANTRLRVRGEEGPWLRVEFRDPQFGTRTGYVEARLVKVSDPALAPMDLSVNEPEPAPQGDLQQQASLLAPQIGRPTPDVTVGRNGVRQGFWFNVGLGVGSLGCELCSDRVNGLSGGLSLGRTINEHVLFGVGTAGWARSDVEGSAGLLDARFRFYPSKTNGFFITTGLGLGGITDGFTTEVGLGLILGVGADIRVGRNVSLTPFWNGFAMRSSVEDFNVGQLGLGVTLH